MAKYVEKNLGKNEVVVKVAKRTPWLLFWTWVGAIVFCWLLLIPVFKAIKKTVLYFKAEIAITSKRIVGKTGFIKTNVLDAPLNKIQNVSVNQRRAGKIFNYGTLSINTAAGVYNFDGISAPDAFKGMIMEQIDQYEEDRVKQQAAEMANAMASVLK